MKNTFHVGDRVEYSRWPNNPGVVLEFDKDVDTYLVAFERRQFGMHRGGKYDLPKENGWWCSPGLLTLIERPVAIPSSNLNSLL